MVHQTNFFGSWIAFADRAGLHLPPELLSNLQLWDGEIFLTSVLGSDALLYPYNVWEEFESRVAASPDTITRNRYLERVNYFGTLIKLGGKAVTLPEHLRYTARLSGELIVLGVDTHLVILNLASLNDSAERARFISAATSEIKLGQLPPNSLVGSCEVPTQHEFLRAVDEASKEITRYIALHPESVRLTKPRVFEQIVGEMLRSFGYEVELTAQTRDGGVDLFAVYRDWLGIPTRYVIECKRWSEARKVSVVPLRALYGVKEAKGVEHALFVTTTKFTRDAWKLVKTGEFRNLTLVDFERLREWFDLYLRTERQKRATSTKKGKGGDAGT